MYDEKKNEELKLSRRTFIKAATGSIAGVLVFGMSEQDANAAVLREESFEGAEINVIGEPLKTHVDSLNRQISLPVDADRVIPSGRPAQILLCTLCPEKIAAVSDFDQSEEEVYVRGGMGRLAELSKTGEMYSGGERSLNTSKVIDVAADIFLDVGAYKSDLQFSLDYLQSNSNTSAVFIYTAFSELPQTYRTLGELLNCGTRAEILASYIEGLYADIEEKRPNVETAPVVLYAGNDLGLKGNFTIQNAAIAYLGGIPAESGETIETDALLNQNIDYVVFNDHAVFRSILSGTGEAHQIWSPLPAVSRGNYAVAPALYHSWFGPLSLFPQTIGLLWLGNLLWPDIYNYDMVQKTKEFYGLFFNHALSDDEARELLGYSSANLRDARIDERAIAPILTQTGM
jgi:iron complex transport system substrate-binding protein